MAATERSVDRFARQDVVLVLVDVQNDFCHPDGSASRAGFDVSAIDPAVDRLVGVLDAARSSGIPVVFVRTTHDATVDSDAWTHRAAPGIGPGARPIPPNCVTGSWGAEFYRVAPQPEEAVVTKHRYSAFVGTDLQVVLNRIGRRALVFAGYTTNVCVETTLRDGLCHDYLVSVVGDACAAFDPNEHTTSLATIRRYFGAVANSDVLAARWRAEGHDGIVTPAAEAEERRV